MLTMEDGTDTLFHKVISSQTYASRQIRKSKLSEYLGFEYFNLYVLNSIWEDKRF
jgi:hypothetical protein